MLDLLPDTMDGVFTQRLRDGSQRARNISKPLITTGIVCERNCNNGWMSRKLEQPMKAATADIILQHKLKKLSPTHCATIAAWAFKATVLANHTGLVGEPYFSERDRYRFAEDQTIPSGVHVWIAQRNAGCFTATYRSTKRVMQPHAPITPHLKRVPDSPYRFELYDCTFSVGYLLLQVAAAKWARRDVAERVSFPPIVQGPAFDEYAISIWPNDGRAVLWPPPRSIRNELFDTIIERLDKFELPRWMADGTDKR